MIKSLFLTTTNVTILVILPLCCARAASSQAGVNFQLALGLSFISSIILKSFMIPILKRHSAKGIFFTVSSFLMSVFLLLLSFILSQGLGAFLGMNPQIFFDYCLICALIVILHLIPFFIFLKLMRWLLFKRTKS